MRAHCDVARVAVLAASCAALAGCGDRITVDYGGSATYFVDNATASGLRVTMIMVPQLGDKVVEAPVLASTRTKVFHDFIIGVNPRPSDTFKRIEIRDSATGAVVHVQDPIDNDLWIRVAPSPSEDYYRAEYTLVISGP